jgi:hypothetical protein
VRNFIGLSHVYLSGQDKIACDKILDNKKAIALFDDAVREYAAASAKTCEVMARTELSLNVLEGWTFTSEMKNGLKPYRRGGSVEVWAMDCKSLTWPLSFSREENLIVKRDGRNNMRCAPINNIVLGNSVPAAAVKQRGRALIITTGRKGYVGGH